MTGDCFQFLLSAARHQHRVPHKDVRIQAFAAAGLGVAVIPAWRASLADLRRPPDDSFQPPAVRTMITVLKTITQRLRNPPMPQD